ncbi:Metallo-dependent phosphatase [Pleomassaria siparia CBS 279.74]|uniref:Metallo-dependent phosphatase n=1 Tax=Pleomassaria siparia CBS 279.74 TaxID=1314801 RepID=A0A6G1JZT5_9PLEO|nr:Metallo-dependent phosphatase [Pleomassaria siparia CBS 279.74]
MAYNRCPSQFGLDRKVDVKPPTFVDELCAEPLKSITRKLWLYFNSLEQLPPPRNPNAPIRVVCIADTHNRTTELPPGDILIHAGDLTNIGTVSELQNQVNWLEQQRNFKFKYVIAGNRDTWLDEFVRSSLYPEDTDSSPSSGETNSSFDEDCKPDGEEEEIVPRKGKELDWKTLLYLRDRSCRLEVTKRDAVVGVQERIELLVFGSPWTRKFGKKRRVQAFGYAPNEDETIWKDTLPSGTDLLITHSPPLSFRDKRYDPLEKNQEMRWMHHGSEGLLLELWRVRPRLHVFGHIHGKRGVTVLRYDAAQKAYERACKRGHLRGYGWTGKAQKTVLVNATLTYNVNIRGYEPIHVIEFFPLRQSPTILGHIGGAAVSRGSTAWAVKCGVGDDHEHVEYLE